MVIVSLTSFGERLKIEAPIAIQSILNNTVLPDKICLVINEEDCVPKELQDISLIEVIISDLDIKGHNKYYHTMLKYPKDIIITIDDDFIYPKTFIEDCLNVYNPEVISACRVHKIRHNNGHLLPYRLWEWESKSMEESFLLFFTGAHGVVYPPGIFTKEDFDLEQIQQCVTTDDIFLNLLSRKHNIKVKRIPLRQYPKEIRMLRNKYALSTDNLSGINDKNLRLLNFENILTKIL